ncbi:MAG: Panacea domain-containing protein [Pseudoxanthomonas sp.]|nr:Panacea domain-containing protein [Pseudoxanthomonas sp.]
MSGRQANRAAFEVDKAIAATALLVQETNESLYPIMKMMYLADKLHLEKFGRFIAGEQYCAMEKGPVPSFTYSMLKHVRGDDSSDKDFLRAREFFVYHANHLIELKKAPDLEELSESEINSLRAVIDTYKRVGKWAIRDMSHDSAWKDAWTFISRLFKKSARMSKESIAQEFDNADEIIQHLRDDNPGEARMPEKRTHWREAV